MEVEAGVSGFVNQYESQMTYPGVAVVKTLYGRNMTPGEFAFNISCENPNANTKGILDSDANFKNDEKTAGETWIATEKLGNLVAAWDTDEDGTPTVSFENNYEEQKQEDQEEPKPEDPAEPKEEQKPEKPEEPKKEEPKEDQSEIAPEIGDESNLWQWGVLLTISVFAFIAGLKRKNANM